MLREKSIKLSFRARILREESLLAFCFEPGEILRFAQNYTQKTFSSTCEAELIISTFCRS